jgi:hypothetical protein
MSRPTAVEGSTPGDDAGVQQHEPISLEVDARFGPQPDRRGDLPRERPSEREAESGCELPRWIVQRFFELAVEHERERVKLARDEERQHDGLAGLRESLLGPVHWRRKPGLTRFVRSTVDVLLIPSLMEERWEKKGFALHCSWPSASA